MGWKPRRDAFDPVELGLSNEPAQTASDEVNPTIGDDCIPNIGPAERRRRFRFGVLSLVVGLVVAAALVILGVHPLLRLPLFLVFAGGTTGIFQAREKT